MLADVVAKGTVAQLWHSNRLAGLRSMLSRVVVTVHSLIARSKIKSIYFVENITKVKAVVVVVVWWLEFRIR